MSGVSTATMVAIGTSAVAAGAALYSGNQQRIAASRASDQAAEAMQQQEIAAQQSLQVQQQASADQIAAQTASADKVAAIQQQAVQQSDANAKAQLQQQQQVINKSNQKSPDVAAMLSANQQAAKGGQSGTMLTGPTGSTVAPTSLSKNTLLGS